MGKTFSKNKIKIQYVSDLHLEFQANTDYIKEHPLEISGDILIIAGDTAYLGSDNYKTHPIWDYVSQNFKQVYVIPGNHEFYGGYDLSQLTDGLVGEIRNNVHYYYNSVVEHENITFIFTPLWSKISEKNKIYCEYYLNDFKNIKCNNNKLTVEDYNKEHEKCLNFLKNAVANCKTKYKIVVTHHVPTFDLVPEGDKNSELNDCFYVDLNDFIKNSNINYWIYGHTHINRVKDKVIGKTKLICNQLGYAKSKEYKNFVNGKCIKI